VRNTGMRAKPAKFTLAFSGFAGSTFGILKSKTLTHFVRGILLKGNALGGILPELWPIALFAASMLTLGIKRYRQTLD